jgi:hypothetical protein
LFVACLAHEKVKDAERSRRYGARKQQADVETKLVRHGTGNRLTQASADANRSADGSGAILERPDPCMPAALLSAPRLVGCVPQPRAAEDQTTAAMERIAASPRMTIHKSPILVMVVDALATPDVGLRGNGIDDAPALRVIFAYQLPAGNTLPLIPLHTAWRLDQFGQPE